MENGNGGGERKRSEGRKINRKQGGPFTNCGR
jgi:hypothetical protein